MNICELKRRLLPYSGYLNATDDGTAGTGGTAAEEVLDLGNDLPDEGSTAAAAPAAPSPAPESDEAPADPAPGGDDADDAGKTGGGIPRARFNEVNDRRKALETEVEALRAQLAASSAAAAPAAAPATPAAPPPGPVDVDALEEQYAQALLDGDAKTAGLIRRSINRHIEDSALQRFEQASQHRQSSALSQEVVERAIQKYPWLDEAEGAVALELIEAAVTLKVAQGHQRHDALAEAISTIAPRFTPSDIPPVGLANRAAPVDTRLERADKRGAADSLLQPAAVQAGMGNRATAPKIDGSTKLSDDLIDGLSQAELDKTLGLA